MERKYEDIFRFLSVGVYPPGYDKSQRYNFRKTTARFTLAQGEIFVGSRRFIKSEEEARRIFREFHSPPAGGHSGISRTRSEITSRFFWHRMSIHIDTWIRECVTCQKLVKPLPAPQPFRCMKVSAVWELLGIDITGPFPKTADGFQYILTATDYFSKWVEAFPLQAISAAKLNEQICSLLGIERSVTAAYHPQANTLDVETNDNVKRVLTELVNEKQNNWDAFLDAALFNIRRVQSTSKYSPFLLMYGREVVFPTAALGDLPISDIPLEERWRSVVLEEDD